MNEVVDGGDLVVLVVVDAFLGEVTLKPELLNQLQDLGLRWNSILPDNEPLILADRLMQFEPAMESDLRRREAGLRVGIENLANEVASLARDELRKHIVTFKNFLIE